MKAFLVIGTSKKGMAGLLKSEVGGACLGSRTCNKMYTEGVPFQKRFEEVSEWNWNISPNKSDMSPIFQVINYVVGFVIHSDSSSRSCVIFLLPVWRHEYSFLNYQIRYSDLSGSVGSLFGQMNSNL